MFIRLPNSFLGIVMIGVLFPLPTFAFVAPEQVAVLANVQRSESLDLAKYYMERRGIPLVNRVELDLPMTETISREVYNQDVLKSVREVLTQKGLATSIKVLVTVFGIPLRVQAPSLTSEEAEWIDDARQWRQSAMQLVREQEQKIVKERDSISLPSKPSVASIIPLSDAVNDMTTTKIHMWKKQLTKLLKELHQEIKAKADAQKREALFASRERIIRRVFGIVGLATTIPSSARNYQQMLANLMHQPSSKKRTHAYGVVQETFGLWGVLAFAHWEIERYQQADGIASVDSELSFLWWESNTYPLAGRLPNPFYLGYPGKIGDWPLPLLLVSRIDAPTVTHAKRMIDQAMATESRGLSGNIYVDARGKKKGPPLSYGFYDADMQDFAHTFGKVSTYPMMLENTEQRLSQPGQAPNVALYVGWYRLRHYEDAFTFNPGAIGYHIASGEAVSIHSPREPGWCKNALERGITVTLGSVGEPYLDAFPLPTEFFGLLYSGKYSLVEAYYLSVRFLSWKMVLFGDPLYRPWANPDSSRGQVAQTLLQNRPFPVSPLLRDFPPPDASQDLSKFPGKYVSFDSRVLSP